MNIDIKQVDLNCLFQFDLLKQILLNLSKNQEDLKQELNRLKESNKIRDERLSRLEDVNNIESLVPDNQLGHSTHSAEIENTNNEQNENIYTENEKNKNNENINDKKITENNNENKEENKEENNKNKNEDINKTQKIETFGKTQTKKVDNKTDDIIIDKISMELDNRKEKKYFTNQSKNISNDIYLSMMKGNREQKERFTLLENKLMKQIESQLKKIKDDFKKQLSILSQENKSQFNKVDDQINNMSQKNIEQDEKIEDCLLKCNNFDVFNMIKDSGDGSVDLAKLLVKSLEDKVFKKFEFIDQRYKQEGMQLMKLSKTNENINIKMEKMERLFNEIKENEIQQMKDDIENNKKNTDKKIDELNSNLNDKEINLVQRINEQEENILKILEEKDFHFNKKYQEINNKQKEKDNENEKVNDEYYNFYKNQNNIDPDAIEALGRRINDLRTKTNNIDSSLKYIIKDWNIDILKKDIKDIKFELEKKITKDNLKDLYNLHLSDLDEINDLRENMSLINEDLKKTIKNVSVIYPKVESLMGHFLTIKQTNKSLKAPQIDTSKFIDNVKYNEGMNQILKKFENIMNEIDSLRRDYDLVKDEQKFYEKKDRIDRLEEEIQKQFDENKFKLQKNKNEINKVSKGFEVEIKSIWNEFKKREQADSWILAKQPVKCFNCATCDNNIKNQVPSEESIPWNKYPQNAKNYRLGKGFSHMLEMMTYEFIKNLDDNKDNNEYQPISEENNHNNSNTSNNNNEDNNNLNMNNIAQIGRSSSETKLKKGSAKQNSRTLLSINSGRVRLPQVYDISKKKIKVENFKNMNSLSAHEKKNDNNIYKNENLKRSDSPQIIKITKKKDNSQIFSPIASSKKKLINSDLIYNL